MHERTPDDRLYVVTRADLPVGLAAAQSVHAAFLFARDQWVHCAPWLRDSNWLVLVTVPDEESLLDLAHRADAEHLAYAAWAEPDLNGEVTAIALAPGALAKRLCANFPLLGREVALAS